MILWIIFGLISSVPFVRGIECYFDSREAAPSLKNCSDEINFCYTFFVNPDYEDVGANGNDIPTNDCANRKYFNCAQDQFDSNYEVNYEGINAKGSLCCCSEDGCNQDEGKCIGGNAIKLSISLVLTIIYVFVIMIII